MKVIPIFGYNLPIYMPVLLVILVLSHVFDVYGKVLQFFGVPNYIPNTKETKDLIQNGLHLMKQEKDEVILRMHRRSGKKQYEFEDTSLLDIAERSMTRDLM